MNFVNILKITIFIFSILNLQKKIFCRSPYRPSDPLMPELRTRWASDNSDKKTYCFKSNFYEEHAIFNKYDPVHIEKNRLPNSEIVYRYDKKKTVTGKELAALAKEVMQEIIDHKKEFKNFKILKGTNFNKNSATGILVLKYKKYPFVLKIFRETPASFVQPYNKGWESVFLYVMGCGINRYLSGWTRIKNLEIIRKAIDNDPYWSCRVDLPRKWYWIPENTPTIEITGYNIGRNSPRTINLPSVYGIITDAIEFDKTFKMSNNEQRITAIKLAHFLGNRLDPNITNFVIEKSSGKIMIIDTEHFATIMGLKEPIYFRTYTSWYLQLSHKCCKDVFGRHKRFRRKLQTHPKKEWLAV